MTLKVEVKFDGMADVAINHEASGCVARTVLVGVVDGFESRRRIKHGVLKEKSIRNALTECGGACQLQRT